ncbi:hypothetical protein [Solemya elarraichensis gill symbiont]|uniref:Uncharacterized protein n=1 Tax=Solemya elarraichensis gill symbiont TaxID=1918949 RepID=A0A1T2LBL7_9GAMM|nr:hypothetical protein [Solemya elarraichensis gill symbiont]OOZ42508.1 hypothetical protein BOW52_02885 [Solemya elarraichensis gill symbiont]
MDQDQSEKSIKETLATLYGVSSEQDNPKEINAFLHHASQEKEHLMSTDNEFNVRLFDEAVDMTVHRLRSMLVEDVL